MVRGWGFKLHDSLRRHTTYEFLTRTGKLSRDQGGVSNHDVSNRRHGGAHVLGLRNSNHNLWNIIGLLRSKDPTIENGLHTYNG